MLHKHFLDVTRTAPAENGVRTGDDFVTYSELRGQVLALASGFLNAGISPGDPVAVLLPNSTNMFLTAHALFAIGAIVMPLNLAGTEAELGFAVEKSEAKAIVADARLVKMARILGEKLAPRDQSKVFVTGEDGARSIAQMLKSEAVTLPNVDDGAAGLYLLSSGSTGRPKIVVHAQSNILADGDRASKVWGLTEKDVAFNMLPSNFALGLLLGIADAAHVGANLIYWHDQRPLLLARQSLVDLLHARKVTFMGAVPNMFASLAASPQPKILTDMRMAFTGGAKLDQATHDLVREKLGVVLRQAYGLTEGIMFAHNASTGSDFDFMSVGKPAGDAQYKLDTEGVGLSDDIGELLIKSSSVMTGYLDDEAETAKAFSDGWLRTGDLARVDENGNLYIVGRSKLLIDTQGYKVDPLEVEDAIGQYDHVEDVVVVGRNQGSTSGDKLVAIIVPKSKTDAVDPLELTKFLRARLTAYKVPTAFEFRSSLPKSPTGKILRGQL